jgi:hypothetical protein
MIAISQSQGGRTFGARYRSYSESRCAQPREESPAGETRTSHGEARRELEQECLRLEAPPVKGTSCRAEKSRVSRCAAVYPVLDIITEEGHDDSDEGLAS